MSIPRTDALLLPWSSHFDELVNADPGRYALTPAQAAGYSPLHEAYRAAATELATARASGVYSKAMTAERDAARAALLAYARPLYALVQASGAVSEADKVSLGVKVVETRRRRVTRPTARPAVGVVSAIGRTVSVTIRAEAGALGLARPADASAAWVYQFVGEDYPADLASWAFAGVATRGRMQVVFPPCVPAGARVWICAAWVNPRGDRGPLGSPVSVNVPGGGVVMRPAALAA